MAHFKELNPILTKATNMLLNNENICKLLSYYPKEVDFSYNPLAEPKIEDVRSLLLDKVYPMPKIPDAETEQICFVDVNVIGGDILNNSGFIGVTLVFDIICHLDSWIIKNGFRPLSILNEIDQMFNNQDTDLPIENRPQVRPFKVKNYANKFYGYQIAYDLQINSNLVC